MIGFSRMNRILEVDYENECAVVQPGVVNLDITRAVQGEGYYYAPGSVVAEGLHHRGQCRRERRRAAHADLRRDDQPRAGPGGGAA